MNNKIICKDVCIVTKKSSTRCTKFNEVVMSAISVK